MDLSSIDHPRLTTKANAIIRVLGDIQPTTDGIQHFEAPTTWLGSSTENALRLMSELAQLLIDLCGILATHTHPNVGAMTQGGSVSGVGSSTGGVKARIDGIAE